MKHTWDLPIRTISEANSTEHWTKKSKRHRQQAFFIQCALKKNIASISLPCHIKITRKGKRKLDFDNLTISQKWVVDAVCDLLIPGLRAGRADNDPRITVSYSQEISDRYGIRIEIEDESILPS